MGQLSEGAKKLRLSTHKIRNLHELLKIKYAKEPAVFLIVLPSNRNDADAKVSSQFYERLAEWASRTNALSTICIAATPPDAARLVPFLDQHVKYQMWVAAKKLGDSLELKRHNLPEQHFALLVLTRYRGSLRHIKTRIPYTYCPSCGKTTKDYGGKKHVYHEYGTLLSDVWRDIPCNPEVDLKPICGRLRELFGLEMYKKLVILDFRKCRDILPAHGTEQNFPNKCKETESPQKRLRIESSLFNGDCLEILNRIPTNSIDFCFADPPYNLQKAYDHWDDDLDLIKYFEWCDSWLSELLRVLKPGRSLAVLNIPLWSVRHYQHLAKISSFQSWIVWDALGFPVRLIMPAHYSILVFSKGPSRPLPGSVSVEQQEIDKLALTPLPEFYCLRSSCLKERGKMDQHTKLTDVWYDIHRLKHNSRRVDHPTQLPPQLMRRLFALYTSPGEMVLDCFNGAGTSTLAAHEMGREYIGIELSPQYHRLAENRHKILSNGGDPFAKNNTIPKAKNSPVARLEKRKYVFSKKALQLDVRRIAGELGRLPTREEVQQMSNFPIRYYNEYFVSWGEVCAAARTTGMSEMPLSKKKRKDQLELPFK